MFHHQKDRLHLYLWRYIWSIYQTAKDELSMLMRCYHARSTQLVSVEIS